MSVANDRPECRPPVQTGTPIGDVAREQQVADALDSLDIPDAPATLDQLSRYLVDCLTSA